MKNYKLKESQDQNPGIKPQKRRVSYRQPMMHLNPIIYIVNQHGFTGSPRNELRFHKTENHCL